MQVIAAPEVEQALGERALVERLRQAFRGDVVVPLRQHLAIPDEDAREGTLLIMPAWTSDRHIGIKIATVFPDNEQHSLPSIMASYLLLSARTGQPIAFMDGRVITLKRTACASALAAEYLARQDAERLLMVGTGALAPYLIRAHAAVRPIRNVLVWGRDPVKAQKLAHQLDRPDFRVTATDDLADAARGAHVISCATMATEPLIRGEWLRNGQHLDLVGGFTPQMREADDEAVKRARIFVDTREGTLAEAGDIVQPLRSGVLREDDIAGDLFELTRGERAGRRFYDQITLFKSVGTAIEDLAAAELVADVV